MKSEADILAESREYLETNGWIQNELGNDDGVCSMGAIIYSQSWDEEYLEEDEKDQMDKVTRLLGQAVFGREVPAFNVPYWNDDESRQKQEILDTFAKAEKIARAGFDPDA